MRSEVKWVQSAKNPAIGPFPAWCFWPVPLLIFNFSLFNLMLLAIFMGWAMYLHVKGRSALWVVRRQQTRMRSYRLLARPPQYRAALCRDVAWDDFDFTTLRKET